MSEDKIKDLRVLENVRSLERWQKKILSNEPDARKVIDWMGTHKPTDNAVAAIFLLFPEVKERYGENQDIDRLAADLIKVSVILLAQLFNGHRPLERWERLQAKERVRHFGRISKTAKELADLLRDERTPKTPPVLSMLGDQMAADIAEMIPENRWPGVMVLKPDSDGVVRELKPGKMTPKEGLGDLFPGHDEDGLVAILENLSKYFEAKLKAPRRDKKPNQTEPEARIFARDAAEFFYFMYGLTPNEVIASCVAIRFPDLDSPPDGDVVRQWRGAR